MSFAQEIDDIYFRLRIFEVRSPVSPTAGCFRAFDFSADLPAFITSRAVLASRLAIIIGRIFIDGSDAWHRLFLVELFGFPFLACAWYFACRLYKGRYRSFGLSVMFSRYAEVGFHADINILI